MTEHWSQAYSDSPRRCHGATARFAAVACSLLVAAAAVAQEAEPRRQSQPEPRQAPAFQPGFLDTLGQATGAILGLPDTRVVIGRERCVVAANGAPDCAPAADALCRAKGFEVGKGLDINTAQKCPTWVWLSGRPPPDGVCVTETFVLRAMCR